MLGQQTQAIGRVLTREQVALVIDSLTIRRLSSPEDLRGKIVQRRETIEPVDLETPGNPGTLVVGDRFIHRLGEVHHTVVFADLNLIALVVVQRGGDLGSCLQHLDICVCQIILVPVFQDLLHTLQIDLARVDLGHTLDGRNRGIHLGGEIQVLHLVLDLSHTGRVQHCLNRFFHILRHRRDGIPEFVEVLIRIEQSIGTKVFDLDRARGQVLNQGRNRGDHIGGRVHNRFQFRRHILGLGFGGNLDPFRSICPGLIGPVVDSHRSIRGRFDSGSLGFGLLTRVQLIGGFHHLFPSLVEAFSGTGLHLIEQLLDCTSCLNSRVLEARNGTRSHVLGGLFHGLLSLGREIVPDIEVVQLFRVVPVAAKCAQNRGLKLSHRTDLVLHLQDVAFDTSLESLSHTRIKGARSSRIIRTQFRSTLRSRGVDGVVDRLTSHRSSSRSTNYTSHAGTTDGTTSSLFTHSRGQIQVLVDVVLLSQVLGILTRTRLKSFFNSLTENLFPDSSETVLKTSFTHGTQGIGIKFQSQDRRGSGQRQLREERLTSGTFSHLDASLGRVHAVLDQVEILGRLQQIFLGHIKDVLHSLLIGASSLGEAHSTSSGTSLGSVSCKAEDLPHTRVVDGRGQLSSLVSPSRFHQLRDRANHLGTRTQRTESTGDEVRSRHRIAENFSSSIEEVLPDHLHVFEGGVSTSSDGSIPFGLVDLSIGLHVQLNQASIFLPHIRSEPVQPLDSRIRGIRDGRSHLVSELGRGIVFDSKTIIDLAAHIVAGTSRESQTTTDETDSTLGSFVDRVTHDLSRGPVSVQGFLLSLQLIVHLASKSISPLAIDLHQISII